MLEILNLNREMCKEHMINYVDLIDFFIKSRVILVKEKIWNFYKNIEDTDPQRNVLLNELLDFLKSDLNAVKLLIYLFRIFKEQFL